MKLNPLKIISLTLSSGLFLSSIPVKAESIKNSYGDLNTNSLNNTLIATDFAVPESKKIPNPPVFRGGVIIKNDTFRAKPGRLAPGRAAPVRVKRVHVKKNGYLKMVLTDSVNSADGVVKVMFKNDALNYLASDAKIKNNKLIWADNTRNSKIIEGTKAKINTTNLIVNNQKLKFSNGNVISNASISSGIGGAGIIGGLLITGIVIGASSGGSGGDTSN